MLLYVLRALKFVVCSPHFLLRLQQVGFKHAGSYVAHLLQE